jgi:NADH-quinone oxidoreductase subunit H
MVTPILIAIIIVLLYPIVSVYIVLAERKILADFQVRLGPMRVGPHGLLQPLADALKLVLKEDIIPSAADKALFWLAPVVATFAALTAFAVLPFSSRLFVADVNIGLLLITATGAIGILGIIVGGWASNSHYPLLGALRSAAQLVSYEVALALALLSPVMSAGTLSMTGIVNSQHERGVWFLFDNYGFMLVPFVVFLVAAIAGINRTPFDLPEAESELVAGFHTEYSGFRWALFMLGENAGMFVTSGVLVTLFLGGWLRPFAHVEWLRIPLDFGVPLLLFAGSGLWIPRLVLRLKIAWQRMVLLAAALGLIGLGIIFLIPSVSSLISPVFWFFLKIALVLYLMIWLRGTLPRFRYDQLMNIGWKYMIPIGLASVLVSALLGLARL